MNKKIKELIKKIEDFPLEQYLLNDDRDIRFIHSCEFKELTSKLFVLLESLNDDYLNKKIFNLNWDFFDLKEAMELRISILMLGEYLNSKIFFNKLELNPYQSKKIIEIKEDVIEFLSNNSATILPEICQSLGLSSGTTEEAFSSKKAYIRKRLIPLNELEFCNILEKIQKNYPDSDISQKISIIFDLNILYIENNFKEIYETIFKEIEQAKYIIWIAVSWITNIDLYRLLYKKQNEGVDIKIIINNDDINNNFLKSKKIENYLTIYKYSSSTLMHNKFCIIDLKTVILGSYNWTNKAKHNSENISIIKDRVTAEEYTDKFIELKSKLINK